MNEPGSGTPRAVKPLEDVLVETLDRMGLFDGPVAVAEVRALNVPYRGTVTGYFNSARLLAREAVKLAANSAVPAIYVTLNPVQPDCLSRALNRLREKAKNGDTTSDRDIECRQLLLIDFDPRRPSGISSTDAEHEAALSQARACRIALREAGWPEPLLCDSGNGAHLLYQIDIPNDDDSRELVRQVLLAVASRWDSPAVDVDKKVFNAARITKLYGTTARKGDSTPDRPHRQSAILEGPDRLTTVPTDLLRALAASYQAPLPAKQAAPDRTATIAPRSDLSVGGGSSQGGLGAAIETIHDEQRVLAFFERFGLSELQESGTGGWHKGTLDHPSHQTGSGKPGFAVNPSAKAWKDLRSDASGGLVRFLEQYHGMSHADAGRTVAEHFNLDTQRSGQHSARGPARGEAETLEAVKARIQVEMEAELAAIDKRIEEAGDDSKLVASFARERERIEKKFHDRVAKAAMPTKQSKRRKGGPDLTLIRSDSAVGAELAVSPENSARPWIMWNESRFHEITTESRDYLLEAKVDVFERADGIVEIDSKGLIRQVEGIRMRDIIAHHVDFEIPSDEDTEKIAVPELVSKTLVARPSPGLRPLTAVIRTPTLRPDGSILEAPGYDEATGLYYLRDSITYAAITQAPTREQALAALKFLLEPLQDFPFCTPAHRAGAVCFLLTCVLRSAIDGVVPGFGFDAPDPGTGKTLCARMGGWIAWGKEPALEAFRHEVEEQEKRATATLLAGKPLVIWDNIVHKFGSEVTDLLITGRYYTGRLLGSSLMPELLNNTVWCFNGNNLRLNNADSIRRLIWIRMAYPKGDPTKRTGFRIGNLRKWVLDNREKLVRACLTIARYGVLNPRPLQPYASFEEWSVLIRQPVVDLLGDPASDPLNGFPSDDPDIHEESAAIAAFYTEWLSIACQTGIGIPAKWTIAEMIKFDSLRDIIAQLAPGDPERRNRVFGEVLKRWKNRAVMLSANSGFGGSWKLVNDGERIKTGVPYALARIQ